MNRVKIKEKAKKIIEKNIWNLWKPILIIWVIELLFGAFNTSNSLRGFSVNLIISLIMSPMTIGLIVYTLNLLRNKKFNINDLFNQYKNFMPIILVTFVTAVFVIVWSTLFLIPGIVAAMSYSMVPYLMADGSKNVMETIKKSKEMMYGYKWNYFIFNLSFLPWILLIIATIGIASIYVVPYINVANAIYYEELKSKTKTKK